jgi:geranylgeranyl diphosphate synthase, type II
MMDVERYLAEKKEIVDSALERYLPGEEEFPSTLLKAIRHSLFAGGKRIRPILSIAAYEAVRGKGDQILPFACALEMIHTYSLIHDDLPAIDNDDYRRGKPTCHKVFGEAIALLAGDALLTEAFRLMTKGPFQKDAPGDGWLIIEIVNQVSRAAGILGMVGGQVVDVESEGKEVDLPTLQYIHTHKTGALILASVQIGAKLGGAKEESFSSLTLYGERVGLAFQIVDDILDVKGKAALLGKSTGGDLSKKKATYPALLGVEESKRRAGELIELSIEALISFGPEADPLREIARFVISREY